MLFCSLATRPRAAYYILAYFLVVFAALPNQSDAQPTRRSPPCEAWLLADATRALNQLRRLGFSVELEVDSITIEHRTRYPHAWARMLDKDLMILGLYTRGPRGGRLKGFDGHILFKLFLNYFGSRVRSVMGDWEENSDNLIHFNELIRLQHPVEEAARSTWTGRQAAQHGFTEVKILDLRGEPGAYSEVIVEFRKPRR